MADFGAVLFEPFDSSGLPGETRRPAMSVTTDLARKFQMGACKFRTRNGVVVVLWYATIEDSRECFVGCVLEGLIGTWSLDGANVTYGERREPNSDYDLRESLSGT